MAQIHWNLCQLFVLYFISHVQAQTNSQKNGKSAAVLYSPTLKVQPAPAASSYVYQQLAPENPNTASASIARPLYIADSKVADLKLYDMHAEAARRKPPAYKRHYDMPEMYQKPRPPGYYGKPMYEKQQKYESNPGKISYEIKLYIPKHEPTTYAPPEQPKPAYPPPPPPIYEEPQEYPQPSYPPPSYPPPSYPPPYTEERVQPPMMYPKYEQKTYMKPYLTADGKTMYERKPAYPMPGSGYMEQKHDMYEKPSYKPPPMYREYGPKYPEPTYEPKPKPEREYPPPMPKYPEPTYAPSYEPKPAKYPEPAYPPSYEPKMPKYPEPAYPPSYEPKMPPKYPEPAYPPSYEPKHKPDILAYPQPGVLPYDQQQTTYPPPQEKPQHNSGGHAEKGKSEEPGYYEQKQQGSGYGMQRPPIYEPRGPQYPPEPTYYPPPPPPPPPTPPQPMYYYYYPQKPYDGQATTYYQQPTYYPSAPAHPPMPSYAYAAYQSY